MQDNYWLHNSQTLNCTANDVRIARATVNDITAGGKCDKDANGNAINCTCAAGQPVTFSANYPVVLTAQTRYDVGVYFSIDGDPPVLPATTRDGALRGQCILIDLDTENVSNSKYIQLDSGEDPIECGDIDAAHNPQVITREITVTCQADDAGNLLLPYCTSWRQPGSNQACINAADPESDLYPGSPAKCHCDMNFSVPIKPDVPKISVVKKADPTSIFEPGANVTYSLTITNTSQFTDVMLTGIVEEPDNNSVSNNSYAVDLSTCDKAVVDGKIILVAGASTTCTFAPVYVAGNAGDQIIDKACVAYDGGATTEECATATVTIVNVMPTATVAKSVDSWVCAGIQYKVVVTNTDVADPLTLTALDDDQYGNIAKPAALGAGVTDTDCVVPQTIGVSKDYTCKFVATVCSNMTFPVTDVVTATMHDDDGYAIDDPKPTGSAKINSITVNWAPVP